MPMEARPAGFSGSEPQDTATGPRSLRHIRPLQGGAPFIICSNCLRLLQLPTDFYVWRNEKCGVRCDRCSEVLFSRTARKFVQEIPGDRYPPRRIAAALPPPRSVDVNLQVGMGEAALDLLRLRSQWDKGKFLGSGSFGQVYLGVNSETGQFCAIKQVKVILDDAHSKERVKQLHQEIELLRQFSHPNIVQYYGSDLNLTDYVSIYIEYVPNGSIHKLLRDNGPITELIIRDYTAQILSGLAYLHEKRTVHRDIKGANILVGPHGEVKFADFGMAKHISSFAEIHSLKGSAYWMAPEIILSSYSGEGYSLAVDIWSLGCTIIEMATAKPPWHQYEEVAAMFKIANSKDIPEIPDSFSEEGKSFLKLCLKRDPTARPSATQLMDHPFVQNRRALQLHLKSRDEMDHPFVQNRRALQLQLKSRDESPISSSSRSREQHLAQPPQRRKNFFVSITSKLLK